MREIVGHKPGRILLWILFLSSVWYIFVLPFVLQNISYLLFGWMPVVVAFYNLQTYYMAFGVLDIYKQILAI